MSFAKWHQPQLPAVPAAPASEAADASQASAPIGPLPPLHQENPYIHLIVGMIQRLDEPDRAQWFRMVLGLTTTATGAEQAVLVSVRDGGTTRVVSTFGAVPGQDPLLRSQAAVDAALRGRDSVLLGLDEPHTPSIIVVPIVREQSVRGALVLESLRSSFRPGDLSLTRMVARRLADPLVDADLTTSPTLASEHSAPHRYGNLSSSSPRMQEIFELVERIAATDHPVIVQGDSGTGKELIARAIHFNGRRRERPFIAENCAAISESLLEAELFGYVKGAFTGADRDRKGFFELADGGTLFLDEIGEMSEKMQKELLRVLQEGEIRPVGGKRVIQVDVRIICASNRDLAAMVSEGTFRKDFFYRLNVMTVELPPLSQRPEDIPLLVEQFLDNIARDTGTPRKILGPGVLEALQAQPWPGNIRELKNEIKRTVALARGSLITLAQIRPRPRTTGAVEVERSHLAGASGFPSLADLERQHVIEALRRTNGNKARAAELLGVNKATVFRKLKLYGI